MGTAVVISSISFAEKNLGKVTLSGGHVESIVIGGPDIINVADNKATFFIFFNPGGTPDRNVVWSIESGSQFASISQDGTVTVLQGASSSVVTIKATSTFDQNIYDTKTIAVTYVALSLEYVASKAIGGIPYITTINPSGDYQYEMVFMLEDAVDMDVFGSRVSSSSKVIRFFGELETSKFRVIKGVSSPQSLDLDSTIVLGKKYKIVISNDSSNGARLYEVTDSGDVLLTQNGNMSASVSSSVPIMLGAMNNNGTPVAYKISKLLIYSFRVFTNSTDVIHLKPHYDDNNSRPALIDILTDTVYPYQSTGTATLYYKYVGMTEQSINI